MKNKKLFWTSLSTPFAVNPNYTEVIIHERWQSDGQCLKCGVERNVYCGCPLRIFEKDGSLNKDNIKEMYSIFDIKGFGV